MTKNNSRLTAILVLCQLQQSHQPLPLLFDTVSTEKKLERADRGLAMNLVYGVLRQRDYLDHLLKRLSRQPLKRLDPLVYQTLAIGLYQLFILSRIPESAAVNETVEAAKKAGVPKRLHGFINGVLRQSIRIKSELPDPDYFNTEGKPFLNHPQWMTDRWKKNFGEEQMIAICNQNNRQPPLTLRINPVVRSRDEFVDILHQAGINARLCRYSPSGVRLENYQGSIPRLPGYAEGEFQVQDEAAQLASLLLQPFSKKGRYLDGCAGLGGKTGHLLQLLQPFAAHLTAVEPEPNRFKKLEANVNNFEYGRSVTLFSGNLEQFTTSTKQKFNGILVDAPCSGTGVTGRHPDIRWRRTVRDIQRYAEVQGKLLSIASSLLLPGGVLVYATCSLEQEENQDVVFRFVEKFGNFSITNCSEYLPAEAAPLVVNDFFQPKPSQMLDGFFCARLVRDS